MAYGGDWGDEPNDGNFCMDGMLHSDHTPHPGLTEYRKAIEPVQTLKLKGNEVTIVNRYDHRTMDHLVATWSLVDEAGSSKETLVAIPSGVKPHTEAKITIEGLPEKFGSETYLRLSFKLPEATEWSPADYELAFGEHQLSPAKSLSAIQSSQPASAAPTATQEASGTLTIKTADGATSWTVDLVLGALAGLYREGSETNLITQPATMDFYRALTDNDRLCHFGKHWLDRRLHQTKHHVRKVTWGVAGSALEVKISGRVAPPVLAWAVELDTTLTFSSHGVRIHTRGKPGGALSPDTFARIGLTLGLKGVEEVSWFGRGPGESYRDKKLSQPFGAHTSSVDDLFVNYEYPQEGGNRTDVRTVEFQSEKSKERSKEKVLRARFGDLEGASFSAMRYSAGDLDAALHPYDLKERRREDVVVRLDFAHHGIGTGSCGPVTLREYKLRAGEFEFEVLLD